MSAIKQPPGTSVDYLTYQPPQQKGSDSFSTVPEKVLELTLSISSWVMCLSLNQSLWQNGRNMLMSQSYLSGRWGGGAGGCLQGKIRLLTPEKLFRERAVDASVPIASYSSGW